MTDLKWLFKEYMNRLHIDNFKELSRQCGMKYQTLLDHLKRPDLFKLCEIQAINSVLHFSSEDLLKIVSTK